MDSSLGRMPDEVYLHGHLVFDGDCKERWSGNVEVGQSCGDGSGDAVFSAVNLLLERYLLKVGCLAGKLYLEVAMDRRGGESCFRQMDTNADDGELGAASDLEHVKVAVAVSGVEGFDGHSDEKVALSGVTDALAASGVADSFDLMQRVGDVIGESRFAETPLTA